MCAIWYIPTYTNKHMGPRGQLGNKKGERQKGMRVVTKITIYMYKPVKELQTEKSLITRFFIIPGGQKT